MLLASSGVEVREFALETKESPHNQGVSWGKGSIVLRLRNPVLHSENGSHIALLQNVQIEAPRIFKVGRLFWVW